MSWADRYRPASFREVRFSVEAAQSGGGRRAAVHEFPFGERPHTEDLGRKARTYTFEAYVGGADYDRDLARLLDALEVRTPGILVHPYQGTKVVVCTNYSVSYRSDEGRIARIALEFVESGRRRFVSTRPDPVGGADEAAAAAVSAGEAEFGASIEAGGPGFVAEAASGEIGAIGRELQALNLTGPAERVSGFFREAKRLTDTALDQVARPFEFAQEWTATLFRIESAAGSRLTALEVYLGLYENEPATSGGAGVWLQRAARNARAVRNLTQVAAGAQAVRLAARIDWESYEEALAARSRVSDALTGLLETVGDGSYDALRALLEKLSAAVPPPDEQLPRVGTVTPVTTTNSLVLAYDQDGNVDGEAAFVQRNRGSIRHPGFVRGGRPLEVLIRG